MCRIDSALETYLGTLKHIVGMLLYKCLPTNEFNFKNICIFWYYEFYLFWTF